MGKESDSEYIEDEPYICEDEELTYQDHQDLQYEPELGKLTRYVDSEYENPNQDTSLEIIDRDDWCDEPPVSISPVTSIPTLVRVLHTFTKKKIQTKEESRKVLDDIFEKQYQPFNQGYRDIRYNFVIGAEGEIYEGRGWKVKPEVLRYPVDNTEERIDIAYIGYYGIKEPPYVMMEAAINLIQYGIKNLYLHPGCKVKHLDHALRFKPQKAYRDITDLLKK